MPGGLVPSDVLAGASFEELEHKARALLQTGRYSIDCWVGNPWPGQRAVAGETAYYMRPAVQGEEGNRFDESWGGTCTFHSDAGCSLNEGSRPYECRALIPSADGQCSYGPRSKWAGKRSLAQAWWPFRHVLDRLRREP